MELMLRVKETNLEMYILFIIFSNKLLFDFNLQNRFLEMGQNIAYHIYFQYHMISNIMTNFFVTKYP